jgi:hypothetical protein
MDVMFKHKLASLQRVQTKKLSKIQEKKGIAKYLTDTDSDEDSNDSLDDDDKDDLTGGGYLGAKSIMQKEQEDHPSKLIDLELLNVLKFCGELYNAYKLDNEEY